MPSTALASPARVRAGVLMGALPAALLLAALVAGVALGARTVPATTALDTLGAVLTGHPVPEGIEAAAVASRVPRVVTGALVGAALAVAAMWLAGLGWLARGDGFLWAAGLTLTARLWALGGAVVLLALGYAALIGELRRRTRDAGATAVQEMAYTLADGFGYVELGLSRGLDVNTFAPGLSFFFDAHVDFFEEIAKFRAGRRRWATRSAGAASRTKCAPSRGWNTQSTAASPSADRLLPERVSSGARRSRWTRGGLIARSCR